MRHLTEDELVLHYYGEAESNEFGAERHLADCQACRAAFASLRRVMETIDAAPVPEPGPSFERTVWARLEPALNSNPVRISRFERWFGGTRALAFAGTVAALVVAIVLWQFDVNLTRTPAGDTAVADAAAHREQVLLTAVSDHIEQSELVLVELANASADEGALDVSLERTAADDLVSAGRLYRETARLTGDVALEQLLEDLELVLVDIARGPESLSAEALADLRSQIEDQELIFKLRVLAAEVRKRQESTRPTPGVSKRTL